eukprot:9395-Heterococcus_DN1.PRE.1
MKPNVHAATCSANSSVHSVRSDSGPHTCSTRFISVNICCELYCNAAVMHAARSPCRQGAITQQTLKLALTRRQEAQSSFVAADASRSRTTDDCCSNTAVQLC